MYTLTASKTWAVAERLRQMIRRRFNIWMPGTLKKVSGADHGEGICITLSCLEPLPKAQETNHKTQRKSACLKPADEARTSFKCKQLALRFQGSPARQLIANTLRNCWFLNDGQLSFPRAAPREMHKKMSRSSVVATCKCFERAATGYPCSRDVAGDWHPLANGPDYPKRAIGK